MEFVPGTTYENASGTFLVVSVGATTLKFQYRTGPRVGRLLINGTADLARLATRTALVQPTSLVSPAPPRHRRRM